MLELSVYFVLCPCSLTDMTVLEPQHVCPTFGTVVFFMSNVKPRTMSLARTIAVWLMEQTEGLLFVKQGL